MTIKSIICDIDGVLMHDNTPVPGADKFLARIQERDIPLVILTNYPSQTAQDLANRFSAAGLEVPESAFYTSAMATADFLKRQEGKKAYVIGEGALIHELYKADLNTDILAGFQAGLETILVLSGVSTLNDVDNMPFRPNYIYPSVADIDII